LRYAVNSELAEADLADIWVEIATDDMTLPIGLSKGFEPWHRSSLNNPLWVACDPI